MSKSKRPFPEEGYLLQFLKCLIVVVIDSINFSITVFPTSALKTIAHSNRSYRETVIKEGPDALKN